MPKKSPTGTGHPAPGQALTLIDVAKVAGVSPITVSRTLRQPGIVSEKLREKVLAAVRETGYVSNMLAGGLATSKSRLVAIFLPTIANTIFAELVQALMAQLTQAGYQTLLGLTGYSAEQEQQLLEALLGRRPDGIVLIGTLHTDASRQRLAQARIPVVEVWDLAEQPLDMLVGFSHEAVGEAVAHYLHGKGYRRYAALCLGDPRGLRRCHSLVAALARLGIEQVPVEVLPAPATLASGREGLRRLFAQGQAPEVVVCSSDTIAQGVMAEAASRQLHIPQGLAVMGFGDLSSAAQVYPALSTVRIDGERVGQLAAQALLARFNNPGSPERGVRVEVGFEIIERQTT